MDGLSYCKGLGNNYAYKSPHKNNKYKGVHVCTVCVFRPRKVCKTLI